ncbi:Chorismate dehydratase [compost metagenome]
MLFSKGPLGPREGFSVAVPTRTAGTTHLLSSLLGDLFGLSPTFVERAGSLTELLADHDAVLLFEDEAFAAIQALPAGVEVWDLGDAWWQFTNSPLIYTLWVMRQDLPEEAKQAITEALHGAKAALPSLRPALVAEAHAATGLPAHLIEGFLGRFNYDFTPAHAQALALLEQRMLEHGFSH